MKDSNFEKPEKDNPEEMPIFSDRSLENSPRVVEEHSRGGETPMEVDSSPQILGSLRRQRRSRRSQRLIVLLCFGLGILVLATFFVMKPGVKEPEIVDEQMGGPILSTEGEDGPTIPGAVGKRGTEQQPSEGGMPEGQKPIVLRPPETPLMSHGSEAEKEVPALGDTELPKGKKGDSVAKVEGKRPDIQNPGEAKTQVAKATEPESQVIPEQKAPRGKFTVNLGSFRERARAERLTNELKEKGYEAFVAETTIGESGTWYRVSVGRFPSRKEAQAIAQELKDKRGMDSFVRELEEATS